MNARLVFIIASTLTIASVGGVATRAESRDVLQLLKGGTPDAPAQADGKVRHYPGTGRARQLSNGLYEVTHSDGTTTRTHGPDKGPAARAKSGASRIVGSKRGQRGTGTDMIQNYRCVPRGSSTPAIQVVFLTTQVTSGARPQPTSGAWNSYYRTIGPLRNQARRIATSLTQQSRKLGGPMVQPNVVCNGSAMSVMMLPMKPTRCLVREGRHETRDSERCRDGKLRSENYDTFINAAKEAGLSSSKRKYAIYLDANYELYCGEAAVEYDANPNARDNRNMAGGYLIFKCMGAFDHELYHALGAVIPGTSNSTGGFHCVDGQDVMCYDDGTERASRYSERKCRAAVVDCGGDDYFHPNPPKGHQLSKRWNLGSRQNWYFTFTAPPKPGARAQSRAAGGDLPGLAVRAGTRSRGITNAQPVATPAQPIDPRVTPVPVPGG